MWSAFQVGAVRLASQKSWLVAAIRKRIPSAARPRTWKGNLAGSVAINPGEWAVDVAETDRLRGGRR